MIQQAQLIMKVEEVSHRAADSTVYMRTANPADRRDSTMTLSAGYGQVQDVHVGQTLRVTVETVDVVLFVCGSCGNKEEGIAGEAKRCKACGRSLYRVSKEPDAV